MRVVRERHQFAVSGDDVDLVGHLNDGRLASSSKNWYGSWRFSYFIASAQAVSAVVIVLRSWRA